MADLLSLPEILVLWKPAISGPMHKYLQGFSVSNAIVKYMFYLILF